MLVLYAARVHSNIYNNNNNNNNNILRNCTLTIAVGMLCTYIEHCMYYKIIRTPLCYNYYNDIYMYTQQLIQIR